MLGSAAEESPREDVHIEAPTICQTTECVNAASNILNSLDPKYAEIDPCSDFDQYVCGGWRNNHDMRPDQGAIFSGNFMRENAQARLRYLIETSGPSDSSDATNFEKIKAGYQACLDTDQVEKRGNEPLMKLLEDFEKVYRVGHSKEGPESGLTDAVLYLLKTGVQALVKPAVSVRYSTKLA